MKKIVYMLLGTMLLLSACENDSKLTVNPDKFAPSEWVIVNNSIFPDHGNTFVLDKADADVFFDTIKWTATDFSYSAAITYSIQMAVMRGNEDGTTYYTNYKTVATTNKTFYSLKVNDINSFILNAGGIKRQETNVLVRISASISSVYTSQESEEFSFTATTYSTDPDKLYFVGDYSDNGIETAEYIYSPKWDGQYDGYAYLPKTETGIWLIEEVDEKQIKWGIESSTAQGGSLKLVKESEGGQPIKPGAFGAGNIEGSFVDSAYYKVAVNMKETTVVKTIQVWRFYSSFFVAGQRNMNYIWWGNNMSGQDPDVPAWNLYPDQDPVVYGTGALLTFDPEEKVWKSEVVYVPKYQTPAGPPPQAENTSAFEFKLRANWSSVHNPDGTSSSSWQTAANLGGVSSDKVDDDGVQSGEINGTGNIKFNGVPGYYQFIIDLNSYPKKYQLIPVDN